MGEQKKGLKRRQFVNGLAALSVSTALAPASRLAKAEPSARATASLAYSPEYPPALTGLRGSHAGSFEVAHALALDGGHWPVSRAQTDETYDLVVVGGGISGLAAAWTYRQEAGGDPRILILDNHDDFGGHAKRNEFTLDGQTLIGFGGSQTMENPRSYSRGAKALLGGLGIELDRFYKYFDQEYYARHKAGQTGIYFDRATYGVDKVVDSPFFIWLNEDAADAGKALAQFPVSKSTRAEFSRLLDRSVDLLSEMSPAQKAEILESTSYEDFLRIYADASDEVIELVRNLPVAAEGVGYDALPLEYAVYYGAPGTLGLGFKEVKNQPYVHHFPDGNAGVARLLVRHLIPEALPGETMEDIVLARADYDALDQAVNPTRIRLQSTAIRVAHTEGRELVEVDYVRGGQAHRVRARHAILATYNQMIPTLCPELPSAQKQALKVQEKAPIVYVNILLRNWRAFAELGVHQIYSPHGFLNALWLDFPVSMGGYSFSSDPESPVVLHGVHVPNQPGQGLTMREQFKRGRHAIFKLTMAEYEESIRQQLRGVLGGAGFDPDRDVVEITVNRWPHGYTYTYNTLFDDPSWTAKGRGPHEEARKRQNRISIANADSHASAFMDAAIDAGQRAGREQISLGSKAASPADPGEAEAEAT
ncbi:MAG: NAD(P)-binding protein [Myxococcota bacterium]|nr:NAD(P)-binding protein [Myxococcota bacterium]